MSQLFQLYSESSKDLHGTIQIQCNAGNRLKLDYIFSVGENRTLLRSLRYNKDFSNSPLISISNGHEPIMSSYTYCDLQEVLTKFIRLAPKRQLKVGDIMKMQVFEHSKTHTKKFLTNYSSDLEIHRNMECSVLKLDVYLRTEGKEYIKLTSLWGDGLIISTPFGSMSRSMFQNGPIFNQNIECIQIVAICPLSLTFRPIVLPKESEILIRVSDDSRSTGQVFADGEYIRKITTGEGIKIRKDNQSTHSNKFINILSNQRAWFCFRLSCLDIQTAIGAQLGRAIPSIAAEEGIE